jgi:hypothetical protein
MADLRWRFTHHGQPFIPAAPGFTLLYGIFGFTGGLRSDGTAWSEETDCLFVRETLIVGWRVDENGGCTPITVDDSGSYDIRVIKFPDGRVDDLCGEIYVSQAEWEESERRTKAWQLRADIAL